MNARRKLGFFLVAVAAVALSGCSHNSHTWAQPVPAVAPGGLIEQPIWVHPEHQ